VAEPSTTSAPKGLSEHRWLVGAGVVGFVLLFAAAMLLWMGYGAAIFVDLVTFVRSCL
jgi:hypothetical protein